MKLKILVASIALAFGCASAKSLTEMAFETGEYTKSRTLTGINASSAYARGYTGKGSVIAILDSGIDVKSPEFINRIQTVRDFTYTNIQDTLGHGTHVAGIAAAAKNSLGVHGVAYDANLMIGKVTTSGIVLSSTVLNALYWASNSGADVINLSFGFSIKESSINPTLVAPGVYKTSFTNTGKLAGNMDPNQWKFALNKETVLVVAAGNDNTKWSGGLPQLATAVDSTGKLMLNGQMLVVGNWNSQGVTSSKIVSGKSVTTTTYQLGPSSNGAAHLCMVMTNNVCQDKFKLSDFYILAPGTGITSTFPTTLNSTGLRTMSGTSMAAPAVSGGVAIIHQMWPQMSGSNIVKLLLVTADKTIQNYDLNLHGQGLMDLDKATRPIGNLTIPTTGRLIGPHVTSPNPLLFTQGSASIGNKTSIMVVDDFQRDFYVKGKNFTAHNSAVNFNPQQLAMAYDSRNNYTQFNNYTDRVYGEYNGLELSFYKDNSSSHIQPSMMEVGYTYTASGVNVKFTAGSFSEYSTWLGNSVGSFSGKSTNTTSATHFFGIGLEHKVKDTGVYANLQHGYTSTNAHSENIQKLSNIFSYSWTLGAEHNFTTKHAIGMMAYQPVSVYRGTALLNAPVGLDSDFNVIQSSKMQINQDIKETRLGVYHKFNDGKSTNSMLFFETRQNFRGQEGLKDNALGFRITKQF